VSGIPDDAVVEPSDEVYRIYGSVMYTVQYWELALTLRWWLMLTPSSDEREAESEAAAKAVDRLEKAFTKVTAGQARRELEGDMPDELLAMIGDLIDDRNRLAHRFLREQQARVGFRPGTLGWLGDARARFDASFRALDANPADGGSYEGVVRPHWPALAEILVERLSPANPSTTRRHSKRYRKPRIPRWRGDESSFNGVSAGGNTLATSMSSQILLIVRRGPRRPYRTDRRDRMDTTNAPPARLRALWRESSVGVRVSLGALLLRAGIPRS
jgi:hypothetical protein